MAASLADLGFKKHVIAEVILSTFSVEGKPNAAPMGLIMEDEQHLIVDLFNTSQTYRNIKAKRYAVANLTSDIEIFYFSTFKEATSKGKLPAEWFEKAYFVDAPKLRIADASIEVSVEHMELLETRGTMKTRATLKVESINATQSYPKVFSRAGSLTIEAIVAATRVQEFLKIKGKQERVIKLLGLINDCNQIVNRIAPDSPYSWVMNDLVERVDGWRKK